jgi:hypothetical protein
MEGVFVVAHDDQSQPRGLQQSDLAADALPATGSDVHDDFS